MQNNPLDLLGQITAAGLDFVIVGGVALRLWGSTRVTQDIDLVVQSQPAAWTKTVEMIWATGGRPRIPEPLEKVANWSNVLKWHHEKNLLAITFRAPDHAFEIDFLIDPANDYPGLRQRAQAITIGQHTYYVAAIADLIAMKQRAGRPQDLLDIAELRNIQARLERE